jgi:hypothetical protein
MSALDRVMGNPAAFPQAVQDATYNPDNYAFSRFVRNNAQTLGNIPSNMARVNQEFQEGTRNPLELISGTAYEFLGNPVGSLFSSLIPQPVEDATAYLANLTGIPQALQGVAEDYPRTARFIEEAGSSIPVVGSRLFGNLVARNMPNELPGFYSGQKVAATLRGGVQGFANALKQAVSPQGMAELNQRGVSKTLTDLVRKPEQRPKGAKATYGNALWGQVGYEDLLGRMIGDRSPLLSKLDTDYFTHQAMFKPDDYRQMSGLNKQDADAFFRTMSSNWGIKGNDKLIMVERQPIGTEGSGRMYNAAFGYKAEKASRLPSVFPMKNGFKNGDDFIQSYNRTLELDDKTSTLDSNKISKINQAFTDNPSLSTITDVSELATELNKIVKFPTTNIVNRAFKHREKRGFKSNDELAKAMEAKGFKINRNKDQGEDADVYFSDSMVTEAMELGGVNIVYKVGKDGNVTSQMSDIQDLFGMTPVGSTKLIAVLPPITKNIINPSANPKRQPQDITAVADIKAELETPAQVRPQDVASAAGNVAALGTVVGDVLVDNPFEEDPDLFGP